MSKLVENTVPARTCSTRAQVVVIVPTYNEVENLPILVERLLCLNIPRLKLLVVDDGSPDGTGEVAERLGHSLNGKVELLQRGRKMGLGSAYVAGMAHALVQHPDYIVQMAADLSHPPEYVPEVLAALKFALRAWRWLGRFLGDKASCSQPTVKRRDPVGHKCKSKGRHIWVQGVP